MERFKFTTIAHSGMSICNPITGAKLDHLLSLLQLKAGDKVLDVGCGKGEMLLRLCASADIQGTGVDINPGFLAKAREQSLGRALDAQLSWHNAPVADLHFEPGSFAAALCIGSSQAYGGYLPALSELAAVVRPGGQILIGEGYWQQPPAQEYLDFLGAQVEDMGTHRDNEAAGRDAGLLPLFSAVSSVDDWDRYEGLYLLNVERYCYEQPDDPDVPAMLERIRAWRAAYLRWGRETLGFGVYLFLRP